MFILKSAIEWLTGYKKMSYIELNNASVDIPVFNSSERSLKNTFLRFASGGGIKKNQEKRSVVNALKSLTFSLSDGDRLGLIGPNGSGKSTLLRVLAGIYHPTEGEITLQGNISTLIDIGLGIDLEATGRENILLRGAFMGFSRTESLAKLDEIIEFSELGDFIDMPVRTYSSGMHLKLAFSVSTVIDPEILLMDEWLSVGDESFKSKAESRLSELVKTTNILVIASHSRDLIERSCNRVIWLENGSIKMDGSPTEVCAAYFG